MLLEQPFQLFNRVSLFSLRDPLNPTPNGVSDLAGGMDAQLAGNNVYVPTSDGLSIYTPQPNGKLSQTGVFTITGGARALQLHDKLAYLASGTNLLVVDVTNPAAPEQIGTLALPNAYTNITLSDGRAYLTSYEQSVGEPAFPPVTIVDIGNPRNPRLLGILAVASAFPSSVAAQGTTLYLAEASCAPTCNGFVRIIDVADPTKPRQVAQLDLPSGAPTVAGLQAGYLLVRSGGSGQSGANHDLWGALSLLDVRDPTQPQLIDSYYLPDLVSDVAVNGPHIYVASGAGGITILRAPALFQPNAFVRLPLLGR